MIYINFLLYVGLLYYTIKRGEKNVPNIFSLSVWVLGALFAIFYTYSSFYGFIGETRPLTLLPFVYLFALIFILYKGVEIPECTEVRRSSSPIVMILIYIIAFSSYLPFLESLYELVYGGINFANIAEIKQDYYDGNIDAFYYLTPNVKRMYLISIYCIFLTPVLFFYYLATNERVNKYIVTGLIFNIINPVLNGVILGNRGAMVFTLLYLFYLYFVFRNTLPGKIGRITRLTLYSLASIVGVIFVLITILRFTSSNYEDVAVSEWFVRYLGESFANFNTECWYFKNQTNGMNTMYFFTSILGGDGSRDWQSLQSITGVRMNVYFTMIGDLLIDFGYYVTPLVVLGINRISRIFKPKEGVIDLAPFIVFSMIAYMFMSGLFVWPLMNRPFAFVATPIFYLLVKLTESKKV